jgi:tripartite-type tricarboxylate transporter receptor subunit TctC
MPRLTPVVGRRATLGGFAGTLAKPPPDVAARLSELSKKALESDDVKAKFADLGSTVRWQTPANTLAYRDSEEARLASIIRASGVRVD